MNPSAPGTREFLHHLRALGVVISGVDGRLRCSAPRHVLTADLRTELARRKEELLRLLALEQSDADNRLTITPAPTDVSLRLAVPQERIWFLQNVDPRSSAYTISNSARLKGRLSDAALRFALNEIARRHEPLRTTFPVVDGTPVQQVGTPTEVPIAEVDLSNIPASVRESVALQRAAEEADRPMDLERGPVVRATLLRLAPEDHVLVVAIHHVSCDQWSIGVLGREFAELYEAYLANRAPRLEPLPIRYADYAYSHRAWLDEPKLRRQLEYWKTQLVGLKSHELPSDRPRTARAHAAVGARGSLLLTPELLQRLKTLAARERSTLFMALIAAFKVVLWRYTGQEDLAVGTPIANRTVPEVERLVGTFVNTLVFRTNLSGNPTFIELLTRVREVALGAFEHQHLSFDRLVEELRPERDTTRAPIFQVLFNVQSAPMQKLTRLGDLDVSPVVLPRQSSQFDLTISIDTQVEGRLSYSYNTALFDQETIERMFAHYRAVLEAVAVEPDRRVADIELMSVDERALILERWNATARHLDVDATVVTWFDRQARLTPEATAVSCGADSLTYQALERQSAAFAHELKSRGAGPGVLVGVCLNRSLALPVALLGILKAGAAYLPLDPAFPQDRLEFMLKDSKAALVVTEERLRAMVPACQAEKILIDPSDVTKASEAQVSLSGCVRGDDLAYVLYTSGSTGRPKGVQIPHRALANFLASMQREPGISSGDRLLSVTTLSFDIAGLELYLPLVGGAHTILATKDETTDPSALMALLEARDITMMQATPTTWRMLLDSGWKGKSDLTILCGGEPMPPELAERLATRSRVVWNMYGPTETTIWSTSDRIDAGQPISIGRPIANTTVYVVDSMLRPTPIGVPGELLIGGDGVAWGYNGRPDLTARQFIPDIFSGRPGARLYRTGDLARFRSDGRLECLSRIDNQVKVRGFRIELGEIESALSTHDSVAAAAATVRSVAAGEPSIVGYVVFRGGVHAGLDDVRRHVRGRLPAYMVPSHLVELAALPLTPNGKIDRAALPTPSVSVAPDTSSTPASPSEQTMAGIWAEVLGVPAVGLDEDFFNLGGHSLLAVGLMSRIERVFNKKIPLSILFERRTVRQLAEAVDDKTAPARWISLVPLQTQGHKPPFFCVHGVGGEVLAYSALAEQMAPDQPFVAFRASGYDHVSTPLHKIEDQAALYVREMIAFQPEGPYYIGGYSHGGRVALEMALQLEAMGKKVAFLGIFDTSPCRRSQPPLTYLARWLRNLPLWFWFDARATTWQANVERVRRHGGWLRRVPFARSWLSAGRKHGGGSVPDIGAMMKVDQLPDAIRLMYQRDFEAFLHYQPTGRCSSVTLFRSRAQPLFGSHEPDLGWRAVCRGQVEVRHIVGNHSSILFRPHVEQLAAELRAALEAAQQQASAGESLARVPGRDERSPRRRDAA